MKIKLTSSSYSLIVVMLVGLVVVALALGMPLVSKLLPLIFGSAIVILAAIEFCYDISVRNRAVATVIKDKVEQTEENKETLRAYLPIGAWIVGFLLVIYLLGLLIACPLLVFSYMKRHGTSWLTAIISAIVTPVVVYFGFQIALEIDLYPGLLFSWLGS